MAEHRQLAARPCNAVPPRLARNLNLGYDYSKSDVTNITGANSPMAWKGGYTIKNSDGSTSIIHDGAETTKFEWQEKYNLLLDFYLNYKKNVRASTPTSTLPVVTLGRNSTALVTTTATQQVVSMPVRNIRVWLQTTLAHRTSWFLSSDV